MHNYIIINFCGHKHCENHLLQNFNALNYLPFLLPLFLSLGLCLYLLLHLSLALSLVLFSLFHLLLLYLKVSYHLCQRVVEQLLKLRWKNIYTQMSLLWLSYLAMYKKLNSAIISLVSCIYPGLLISRKSFSWNVKNHRNEGLGTRQLG